MATEIRAGAEVTQQGGQKIPQLPVRTHDPAALL